MKPFYIINGAERRDAEPKFRPGDRFEIAYECPICNTLFRSIAYSVPVGNSDFQPNQFFRVDVRRFFVTHIITAHEDQVLQTILEVLVE